MDLNIVARILDLLIVLDVPLPDVDLTTDQGAALLLISKFTLAAPAFGVLARRIRQITGVHSVETVDS